MSVVTIRRAENGWIVEHDATEDDQPTKVMEVFEETAADDWHMVDSLRNALYAVIEALGAYPGDHAEKRLYVVVAPGDERPDYPKELDALRWPKSAAAPSPMGMAPDGREWDDPGH